MRRPRRKRIAGEPSSDDLGHRAAPERRDRGAAGHRLDHDQAKGSGQSIGKSRARAPSRNAIFSALVEFADELELRQVNRPDHVVENSLVDATNLRRDLQFKAGAPAMSIAMSGRFFRRNAAEERSSRCPSLPRRGMTSGMPCWTVPSHSAVGSGSRWASGRRAKARDAQRDPLPTANWLGTVQHGISRCHAAARQLGQRLPRVPRPHCAGKSGPTSRSTSRGAPALTEDSRRRSIASTNLFRRRDPAAVDLPHVEFVGELDEAEKMAFLDGARALLFPIDWPEPFGLVMIEAMACGTPVVAFRRGSVPEVVDEGITGYIVDDAAGAVAALAQLDKLDRRRIHEIARQRFFRETHAGAYLRLYDDLLDQRQELSRNARPARAVGGGGAAVAIGVRGAS